MHDLPQIARKPITVASFMAPKSAGNVRGVTLLDLRESRRLTQKDVYERVGVSEAAYRRWEKGRPITRDHLRRLAKFFDVAPDDLIQKTPTQSKPQQLPQLDRIEAKIDQILAALSQPDETKAAPQTPSRPPGQPPQVTTDERRIRRRKAN